MLGSIHPKQGQCNTALRYGLHCLEINRELYPTCTIRNIRQNQPARLAGHSVKKLYIPSRPGYVIVNVDASGAEIKTLTAYLLALGGGDELISNLNNDKNFDVHSYFCAKIYGIRDFGLPKDFTDEQFWDLYLDIIANKDNQSHPAYIRRKRTKNVVFGK